MQAAKRRYWAAGRDAVPLAIVNSRGVPGTLACFARDLHDGGLVFLTSRHVLFGSGAREGDPVWIVDETAGRRRYVSAGRSLWGKEGVVQVAGRAHFVDCAVGSWSVETTGPAFRDAWARPGDRVSKTGAATGSTTGVVAEVGDSPSRTPGRASRPPGQILLRSEDAGRPFAEAGDSGSLVLNEAGHAIGLLWGVNSRGDGVACPIGAVLHALSITLDLSRQVRH